LTFLEAPPLNPEIPFLATLSTPMIPKGDPPNIAMVYIYFYIYIKYGQALLQK
jgi:hypothetical protein